LKARLVEQLWEGAAGVVGEGGVAAGPCLPPRQGLEPRLAVGIQRGRVHRGVARVGEAVGVIGEGGAVARP
jgi:hypothetical protein